LARWSTSFDRRRGRFVERWFALLITVVLLGLPPVSCSKKAEESAAGSGKKGTEWNRASAEQEYRQIQAELNLAKTEKPYLVVDLRKKLVLVKLKGAVVWSYPMDFAAADSAEARQFTRLFRGDDFKVVRTLFDKHMFEAAEKTPDSILAIVGRAVRVDPDLLQRNLPERFQLEWEDGLFLEIRTDISGEPISKFRNTLVLLRKAVQRPFGEAVIVLKMDAEAAMTLYRATPLGMPTMLSSTP
jgi:hypothetical protein